MCHLLRTEPAVRLLKLLLWSTPTLLQGQPRHSKSPLFRLGRLRGRALCRELRGCSARTCIYSESSVAHVLSFGFSGLLTAPLIPAWDTIGDCLPIMLCNRPS